eukprot:Skav235061  [mRNA]  locus=scaffold2047:24965:26376:+ [translate_table: standard]
MASVPVPCLWQPLQAAGARFGQDPEGSNVSKTRAASLQNQHHLIAQLAIDEKTFALRTEKMFPEGEKRSLVAYD